MVLSLSSPRSPGLALALSALVVGVAACSGEPDPTPSPAPPTSTTTTTAAPSTTTPAPPLVSAQGLPADLVTTMTTLYAGETTRALSGPVADTLAKRTPVTAPITVKGEVKAFKDTPIAVVVHDKDVTLLAGNDAEEWTVVGGWWPSLGIEQRVPSTTMRVLAIGSDARPGQDAEKFRADALQIIGVDAKGVGGLVGIPRDSWVPLSTGGTNKINAAMVFGGPEAEVETVRNATGVPIDGYVMTGFRGFEKMIDAVGGLDYRSATSLTSHVGKPLLKQGANTLAGLTTLNFARERKNIEGGDFGRSANQGRIIKAGMAEARRAGVTKLPTYLQAIGENVRTDLSAPEILALASSLYLSDPYDIPGKVAVGSLGTRGGQSVVLLGGEAGSIFADIKDGRLG